MATMYNKTALNKMKKNQLVQMFLDQQAKINDMELSSSDEKLKDEIVDLKYHMENELYTEDQVEILREEWIGYENKELRKEIVEMKAENEKLKGTIVSLKSSEDDLRGYIRDIPMKIDNQLKELMKENEELACESIINCEECQCNPGNDICQAKEWIYLSGDTESNLSLQDPVWYCKQCFERDPEPEPESESDSDSSDDEYEEECVCCGTNFNLVEEQHHASTEIKKKYKDYFGSQNDDGDICSECLDKIY